ncbi:Aspartyl/glutamyl-tRNA(Asn/Gln) amidotransferase subunit B, partial [Mycoplasma putrefaciens]
MKNFEVIIGIENHVELKTKTKMFSPAPVSFGQTPNTQVHEIDMAYPGSLPSVNKKGVELAILACNALNMKIDTLLKFDRKNYFYPDLTKGFQITQQFNPIGLNGSLEITLNNNLKKIIEIERLHIEEDTAKQIHKDDLTYLDYNRAGVGLIEIVTKPVIRSADEACAYVEKLREILLLLNVSDVKMNEGSLRTDINISIRPFGSNSFSNKVEIKNLNSISNIRKAIDFEVVRQTEIILANKVVEQETRRFDDSTNKTVLMRSKSDALDYRYFREPNIFPIQLDKTW